MARELSLANKCQLLFGAATLLIIGAALVIPWFIQPAIVDQSQLEMSRQLTRLYNQDLLIDPAFASVFQTAEEAAELERDLQIRYFPRGEWTSSELSSPFERRARREFAWALPAAGAARGAGPDERRAEDRPLEIHEALWDGGARRYRYAALSLDSEDVPRGVLVIVRLSEEAASQIFVFRAYLVLAGLFAGLFAIGVFAFILKRVILSPVRSLRDTADLVKAGNLHVRSDMKTGDEFQELAEAFNAMLENLADQQQQLRAVNKTLDLKLTELAERNVALYEAAKLKGDFLANVSHELRTPLNSIIGFTEMLQEIVQHEDESDPDGAESPRRAKRRRYLANIVQAGRSLLEMINELLTMAKIDAGNIDLRVQPMNVADACEGLIALIKPLADRKGVRLDLQLASVHGGFTTDARAVDLPLVETDPKKLEQVVFNFLSNAVKFTPEGGEVTLRAERLVASDGDVRVRLSVLDTGPGIPRDKHDEIFEKFTQLDAGHTKTAEGTGLGLAIAKRFTHMLQGEIQLVSEPGRGSMFSVIVPASFDRSKPVMAGLPSLDSMAGIPAIRPEE